MVDTNATATDSGAASAPSLPTTAEGFFDAAKNQFFPEDDEQEASGTIGEGEEEESGETVVAEGESGDEGEVGAAALGEASQEAPPAFKPFEFKGKVLGEEVQQKFESEKDLNRVLAQGLAAPKLYKEYTQLLEWKESIAEDLQYSQDLISMSKEDPKGLLDLLSDEMIPQEALADWVYDKYQEFKRLANMSQEERERELKLREAQRIIEGNKHLEEERKRLTEQKTKLAEETERKQFDQWRSREIDSWTKKVPVEYRESVEKSMKAVVAMAAAEMSAGKRVTFKQMSQWLSDILAPALHAKSPAQMKREAGKAMEQKKNQSTDALRGSVSRAVAEGSKAPQQKGPVKADDIFNMAKRAVAEGKMKLRN